MFLMCMCVKQGCAFLLPLLPLPLLLTMMIASHEYRAMMFAMAGVQPDCAPCYHTLSSFGSSGSRVRAPSRLS